MNRMVASIISAMVSDPRFADAIKAKIGSAVDTNDLEKQLEASADVGHKGPPGTADGRFGWE